MRNEPGEGAPETTAAKHHILGGKNGPYGPRNWLKIIAGVAIFGVFLTGALAKFHPANIPVADAKVQTDGSFTLKVRFDLLAYVLDETPAIVADAPMNALADGPTSELQTRLTEAQSRFRNDVQALGDNGEGAVTSIKFPTAADVQKWLQSNNKPRLPVMMTASLTGHLPAGAKTVAFHFPDVLGTVVLTTELPYREPASEPLDPGTTSTPLNLPTEAEVKSAEAAVHPRQDSAITTSQATVQKIPSLQNAASVSKRSSPGKSQPSGSPINQSVKANTPQTANAQRQTPNANLQSPIPAPPFRGEEVGRSRSGGVAPNRRIPSPIASATQHIPAGPAITLQLPQASPTGAIAWYNAFPRYVKMGFLHIVPEGLDHILFVLGLFLLSTRFKDLLKQITAFTIAHSLTLGLSLYGVIRLPSSIVEPVIALSIAFVAIENLCTTELKVWRPYVVFLFGLVHGLGFAGALQDAGLAKANFLTALVGFNSGVELGQLSVVAGAFLLVGWFRSSQRYRSFVTVPASLAIAFVAIIWTFQRIF